MKPEEKEAIDRLYFEMYDALVCYANSYLNDRHRSEELTQEVFLSAVRKPEALLSCPNPKGWLHKYAPESLSCHNTPEVGVNLRSGCNGDLTSRKTGSVGTQMVNKMCSVRTARSDRHNRIAPGHVQTVEYIASVTV